MMDAHGRGRRDALRRLGFGDHAQDNSVLTSFIKGLPEHTPLKKGDRSSSTGALKRQGWGKDFTYTTSEQEFSGGGVRR